MKTKTAIILSVSLLAVAGGVYFYVQSKKKKEAAAVAAAAQKAKDIKTGAMLANLKPGDLDIFS